MTTFFLALLAGFAVICAPVLAADVRSVSDASTSIVDYRSEAEDLVSTAAKKVSASDFEGAITDYRASLRICDDRRVHRLLAQALRMDGQVQEADKEEKLGGGPVKGRYVRDAHTYSPASTSQSRKSYGRFQNTPLMIDGAPPKPEYGDFDKGVPVAPAPAPRIGESHS